MRQPPVSTGDTRSRQRCDEWVAVLDGKPAHSAGMITPQVLPTEVADSRVVQLTVVGCLARFKAISRTHAESDLRAYLTWCRDHHLDPLTASRPQVELYLRWMQEIRRLKPSTVSRRTSVVAGFYRTAVIDGLLEHSPAGHVRRPTVPAESPTLGLTHLQLEALLTAARQSPNRYDFARHCCIDRSCVILTEGSPARPVY